MYKELLKLSYTLGIKCHTELFFGLTLAQELVSTQYSTGNGFDARQFSDNYPPDPLCFLEDYRPSQGDIT